MESQAAESLVSPPFKIGSCWAKMRFYHNNLTLTRSNYKLYNASDENSLVAGKNKQTNKKNRELAY